MGRLEEKVAVITGGAKEMCIRDSSDTADA